MSSSSSSSSSVADFIRKEVLDWDDDVIATARFKAFSGQRCDWEPKFCFWRDLILKVAHHLGIFIIHPSEVKNNWFTRGGLTPLCINQVLLEMHNTGDIFKVRDLRDPSIGSFRQMFKQIVNLIGISKSSPEEILEEPFVLKTLLQERAFEVIRILSESHWTSSCVITMGRFQSICKGCDESSAILSYLSQTARAQYLSINKMDFIEGLKVSLVPRAVPAVTSLDRDSLHLLWTMERVQQQLDVIDQRCERSRTLALASLKSGNKVAAQRYIRHVKLNSESRNKCTSLLNRVEEVLGVIADAESTKKVTEAIQIGARVIKENGISIEEVHACLEELDESVASQKHIQETLESAPLPYLDTEDEEAVEEEFRKLQLELGDENQHVQTAGTVVNDAAKEEKIQESVQSISQTILNLKLEAA